MFRITNTLPTMVDMLPKEALVKRKVLRTVERAVGDRRDEAVYVHPRWLTQHSELDRDTLSRHLSDLRKLPGFEYVPPFRGRAIHFRKRDVAFDKLGIDFKALDTRKKADFEKLERVVQFAQGKVCRQISILQYFGDPDAKPCGLCDRCQGQAGWPKLPILVTSSSASPNTSEIVVQAKTSAAKEINLTPSQKAEALRRLWLVTEAIGRHRGLFGKGVVADFLCGGQTEKIERLRLSRIQGYGLLKGSRKKEVEGLLEMMLTTELLESKMPMARRPTIGVSELGWKTAKGESPIPESVIDRLRRLTLDSRILDSVHPPIAASTQTKLPLERDPRAEQPPPQDSGSPPSENNSFEKSIANAVESVSATNKDREQSQPNSASHEKQAPLQPEIAAIAEQQTPQDLLDSDWQWTHRLAIGSRFTLTEIAAIRRIAVDQVLEHLTIAADQGLSIPMQRLLDASTVLAFEKARIDPPAAKLLPVFSQRPALWRLAQALRG